MTVLRQEEAVDVLRYEEGVLRTEVRAAVDFCPEPSKPGTWGEGRRLFFDGMGPATRHTNEYFHGKRGWLVILHDFGISHGD